MKSGLDLSREGAAMLPELFPNCAQWPAAKRRLRKRYRTMIDSGDPALMNVGFFLFGLAEAMNGRGRHGANPILPASASLESAARFLPSDMGIEPLSAVARALRGFSRDQLGSAIEVLIALMDVADGDPEAENATDAEDDWGMSPLAEHFTGGPGCAISDGGDISAIEWTSAKPYQRGQMEAGKHEDDEEDDAPEDDDSDKAIDDDPCDDPYQDLEIEQMANDVPAFAVFTEAYNIFNDKRTFLGMNASVFLGKPRAD